MQLVGTRYVWDDADIAYLKNNYYKLTIQQLNEHLGISTNSVMRKAKEFGLSKKNAEDLIRANYDGCVKSLLVDMHETQLMTVQQISIRLGVSRGAIKDLMTAYGINIRGQADALKIRWERMTDEEKAHTVAAAHAKTKELAEKGEHTFQIDWRENRDALIEKSRARALHMCKVRKRNGMTGKTGALHHNWNPNRTKEDRVKFRKTTEHYKWLRAVYERDNHTCQICESDKSGKLNAHHIFNYADYEELRHEVSNGITLCKDCHVAFHNEFGYGENTAEQFNEFVRGVGGATLATNNIQRDVRLRCEISQAS